MTSESSPEAVSETFDPSEWEVLPGFDFTDITYHRRRAHEGRPRPESGVVRVAFDAVHV